LSKHGSDQENQLYEKLRSDSSTQNRIRDLIQALTSIELDIVVTDDNGVRVAIEELRRQFGEEMRDSWLDRIWRNVEGQQNADFQTILIFLLSRE
jgi:hypothetical protein